MADDVTAEPTTDADHVELLFASPLFDSEYYVTRYMDRPTGAREAAAHFLRYGAYDERNPSEAFSTRRYMESNPDVALTWNQPALLHYVLYGHAEGRVPLPVIPASNPTEGVALQAMLPVGHIGDVRIAVVIHAFYPDYNRDFIRLLEGWRRPFDLYITGSDQDVLDDLAIRAGALPAIHHVEARLCPNRGRNFGPMLVEFGDVLGQYDVVGHVHTKKSLYTGQARRDWALHCISGVLNSPEYLEGVLGLMTGSAAAGLVHAERHWSLPYWALHWLRNAGVGAVLAGELGLPVTKGFVDYPVGGMFWIHRDALAPLLARQWRYDDFPTEAGQTDGTTQHALERLIGVACAAAGRGEFEWAGHEAAFRRVDRAGETAFRAVSRASVRQSIRHADVVSFDIFDTLLYRTVQSPDDIRELIEPRMPGYRAVRGEAEARIRARTPAGQDVGMMHIAQSLQALCASDLAQALSLLQDEFEHDVRSMRGRRPVIQLVEEALHAGKRVIYVSDMYYGDAEIRAILAAVGVPEPHALYISSGCGYRKDRGDMWSWVRQHEAGRIVHLGDNMVSDVQNAVDHGIDGVYLPTVAEKAAMLGLLKREPTAAEWEVIFPIVEHFGLEPFFC